MTDPLYRGSALDLFAGAGGWSLACKRLGIDEVGVENMPAALATRAAAGFKTHDVTDVWDIDYADLRGQYDGLIASPPCQTFSLAGKGAGRKALDDVLYLIRMGEFKRIEWLREAAQRLGDERTALVLAPLHAAWEMRPEWIAWEQVPTVLPVWEACADELRSWGYSVWTGNLQAEQYGVPQTRKRAFLIAHREREVAPPAPTHSRYYARDKARLDEGVLPWVSMAQALGWGDFTMVSSYGTGGGPANRGTREGSEPAPAVTSKIDRNKIEGWGYRNRPAPTITGGSSHAASGIEWGGKSIREGMIEAATEDRPEWAHKRPSTTIVGSFKPEIVAAPGYRTTVSRQNALDSIRVSVAEAGVLQSFPADFPWQGAKGKQYLQCGNAVPPLLAEAVLRAVL